MENSVAHTDDRDLADILKDKLKESQKALKFHSEELQKAKKETEFHRARVEYLTNITQENQL